ncbi:TPA: YdaU family protein [Acinetobacter baumannii]|uniref:YdaU family protein n=1 Tax=Acinetobacter pittii TaxID=48296 RepID=UPI0005C5730E|nr:YdaU family protein [Acinetobacter pittii]MDC4302111.1 YdaU family protein [Acinetobacter baumannii]MDC4860713.1 YdaU family protein [Acinetobacter baumannii]
MHYYERNIGDYYRKAGRLNILQHGVYNLLMDACYDRESFPTLEEAIEWVWAETEEEIDAVKFVLKKFFKLNEDGVYIQNHIKEELEKYRAFLAKQAENGKKGGRPKKNPKNDSGNNGNDFDNSGFKNESQENPNESELNPEKPKETQTKPKPSNHLTNEPSNQENNICPPNGEPVPAEKPKENFKSEIQEVFEFWKVTFNKNNRTILDNQRKSKIQARLKEGYTVEDIKTAIVGCSKSQFHIEGNHTDLTLICRDATKLDHFLAMSNPAQVATQPQTEDEQPAPTQYKVIEGRW